MARDLVVNSRITIPQRELRFTFARSSGPGGQNVNKVNTKAVLRWTPSETTALTEAVQSRFIRQFANRITDQGELILNSDRYRTQARNIEDCLTRLKALVNAAAIPPTIRRVTRKPWRANETRLQNKKATSQKKSNRRSGGMQDD